MGACTALHSGQPHGQASGARHEIGVVHGVFSGHGLFGDEVGPPFLGGVNLTVKRGHVVAGAAALLLSDVTAACAVHAYLGAACLRVREPAVRVVDEVEFHWIRLSCV